MADPLVQVRDLVKHFPPARGGRRRRSTGPVRAVDGVSLEVLRGETLGLVGETGCGKSTLGRLIAGLLEPTSGTVAFEGEALWPARGRIDLPGRRGDRRRRTARRREVQLVFQDPYSSLNPRRTVGSIVGEPFAIHGLKTGPGERRRAVQELMEQVGLDPGHLNRYPHEFSGGQRQRVGIARAIALRPKLLVADEPVSALDVSIQAQILNLLRDLQRDLGLTMILIAHDLSVVRHMCDRVAVMYLGQVVELATGDELFAHPRHPYTGALLSAVPVPDPGRRALRRRQILRGDPPSPTDPPPACRFHPRCPKAEEVCARETPPLAGKEGGNLAACHFPLRDPEVEEAGLGPGPGRRPLRL